MAAVPSHASSRAVAIFYAADARPRTHRRHTRITKRGTKVNRNCAKEGGFVIRRADYLVRSRSRRRGTLGYKDVLDRAERGTTLRATAVTSSRFISRSAFPHVSTELTSQATLRASSVLFRFCFVFVFFYPRRNVLPTLKSRRRILYFLEGTVPPKDGTAKKFFDKRNPSK